MSIANLIVPATSIGIVAIGVLCFSWVKILSGTNKLLKEQNIELKADNKEWQKKHVENEKAISNLQGQIDIIKNIPLQSIDQTLKDIKVTLLESSVTLSQDTAKRAKAVRKVKSDLENKE